MNQVYDVAWNQLLGQGCFAHVIKARCYKTSAMCAFKVGPLPLGRAPGLQGNKYTSGIIIIPRIDMHVKLHADTDCQARSHASNEQSITKACTYLHTRQTPCSQPGLSSACCPPGSHMPQAVCYALPAQCGCVYYIWTPSHRPVLALQLLALLGQLLQHLSAAGL